MDFRYTVCPANLHTYDLSFSQQLISVFLLMLKAEHISSIFIISGES